MTSQKYNYFMWLKFKKKKPNTDNKFNLYEDYKRKYFKCSIQYQKTYLLCLDNSFIIPIQKNPFVGRKLLLRNKTLANTIVPSGAYNLSVNLTFVHLPKKKKNNPRLSILGIEMIAIFLFLSDLIRKTFNDKIKFPKNLHR